MKTLWWIAFLGLVAGCADSLSGDEVHRRECIETFEKKGVVRPGCEELVGADALGADQTGGHLADGNDVPFDEEAASSDGSDGNSQPDAGADTDDISVDTIDVADLIEPDVPVPDDGGDIESETSIDEVEVADDSTSTEDGGGDAADDVADTDADDGADVPDTDEDMSDDDDLIDSEEVDAGSTDAGDATEEIDVAIPACVTDTQCDDSNPCTTNVCVDGACVATAATAPCSDSDACTEGDVCGAMVCAGKPKNCDDGNTCTNDACVDGSCKQTPNSSACSDGDACTVDDVCTAGACKAGAAKTCDDGDKCTADACAAPEGCVFKPISGCKACQKSTECDDNNPCTVDLCADGACSYIANGGAACDDGSKCTDNDLCNKDICAGQAKNCDDGNACTSDSCDSAVGCKYVQNTAPCNDGDFCTIDDTCKQGVCSAGAPKNCDDGNVCTEDGCNPATGKCLYQEKCVDLVGEKFDCQTGNEKWQYLQFGNQLATSWMVDNSPIPSQSGGCTLNFNNKNGNYCGFGSCDGSTYWESGNSSAGSATYVSEIDATGCKSLALQVDVYLDVEPGTKEDLLWLQFHTGNFGDCNATTPHCADALNCSATSMLAPKEKVSEWVKWQPNISAFVGKKFKLRWRFSTCHGVLNEKKGAFIDNLKITCLK